MTSRELATGLQKVFDGYTRACGLYNGISDAPNAEGKLIGSERATVRKDVTVETFEAHLTGKSGLGIIPIRADNTVMFGAIDIDEYAGLSHSELAKRLARLKLPLIVCRSKSGGAHLYAFCKEPVPAARMIAKLKEIAAFLGHGTAEVFPKQHTVNWDKGDLGSSINAPYFKGLLGARYAINPEDGEPLDVEEFLKCVERNRVSPTWFTTPLATSDDMPQAPPCLQHLTKQGFPPGTRNQGLFNLGIYAKKLDPERWEAVLDEMNRKYMEPPLKTDEVAVILKSLRKKEYNFRCSDQPLCGYCNRELCRTRKYGIGQSRATVELGHLVKIDSDPPIFFASAEGRRLRLCLEELLDARRFQRACVSQINRCPPICKPADWSAMVDDRLQHDLEVIPAPDDASPTGAVWDLVQSFCTGRAQALSRDELLLGKPWTEGGRTYFRSRSLQAYIKRNGISDLKPYDLWAILRERGGQHESMSLKGTDCRVWSVPAFVQQSEPFNVPQVVTEAPKAF